MLGLRAASEQGADGLVEVLALVQDADDGLADRHLDACVLGASASAVGPLTRLCNERVGAWLAAAFSAEPVRASRSLEGASRVAALDYAPILSRAASLSSQDAAAALVIARRALDASSSSAELPFVGALLQNEDRAIRVAALNVCAHLTSVPRAPVEASLDESDGVVFGAALAALSVIDARAAATKAVRVRSLMESAAVLEAAVVAVERRPVPLPDALDATLVDMLASPFTRAPAFQEAPEHDGGGSRDY